MRDCSCEDKRYFFHGCTLRHIRRLAAAIVSIRVTSWPRPESCFASTNVNLLHAIFEAKTRIEQNLTIFSDNLRINTSLQLPIHENKIILIVTHKCNFFSVRRMVEWIFEKTPMFFSSANITFSVKAFRQQSKRDLKRNKNRPEKSHL